MDEYQQAPATPGTKTLLAVGDVVQLIPGIVRNRMFSGCFLTVTEPKSFGAQGYVQALGKDEQPGGQAYYRATWEEMTAPIGKAEYVAA